MWDILGRYEGYDYNGGQWWTDTFIGSPTKTGSVVKPDAVPDGANPTQGTFATSNVSFSAQKGSSRNYTLEYENREQSGSTIYNTRRYRYASGYTGFESYKVGVDVLYYGINTTKLYNLYQQYSSEYGLKSYSDIYTGASWNRYIAAMRAAKSMYDGKETGIITQTNVVQFETDLINAVKNLEYLNFDLPAALYSSGEGYGYSNRPDKVKYYSNLEFDVDLYEGYTQSVPTVTVNGKTYNGTKKDADTYHFVIPVEKSIDKIVVNNVVKNTYTVSIPTSATGLTVGNGGSKKVTHGGSISFTVTKNTGYTQKTPVVKVNGNQIGGVQNGNTYTYTITGITSNKTVTIDGQSVNSYKVNYNLGEGASKNSGSANSINHFGSATVKIDVDTAHNQNAPVVSVSNGSISGGTRSGNTYTYTLSGVTADTTVTAQALAKNKYTVTIPTGTGYTGDTAKTVTHGETTSFTITLETAYTQNSPVAKIDGKELSYTQSGNSYTFTTGTITADKTVEISNVQINKYQYKFPTGEGFTVADFTGYDHNAITHGDDYWFTVTVDKAHSQTMPTVTLRNGAAPEYTGTGFNDQGDVYYVYSVKNVTAHNEILVEKMNKNTYSAALPFGTGYKATNTKADAENVVKGIVYGTDLAFTVALEEQYNRSNVVVKFKGTILEPDEGGTYTIENITRDIEKDEITVEGVELNRYCIALPLETQPGFTIEVGEGLNAKAVLSGTNFNFKFFLDPAYSDSKPVIEYSANGGNKYQTITPDENGVYWINNVLTDCIVRVQDVKKNTYKVDFLDDNGNVLDSHTDVEYGSEVKYTGDIPTKATDKLSETEDKDGNTVIVERKYKFIGWSQDTSNVTSNMEVTPIFEVTEVTTTIPKEGGEGETVVTKKTANIIFISDEVVVHKETVEKGKSFAGWDEVPVKTSSNPYESYEFLGWDTNKDGKVDYEAGETAIENVEDDVTFVAVFKSNLPSQTVTFYTYNGEKLLYSDFFKRGERAIYAPSSIPSRTDKAYEYTFEGWSYEKDADETNVLDKIVVADKDITVYAAYSKEMIVYTYEYNNDGAVLQSGKYNFVTGEPTDYKYTGETPERASTASTDFTFDGWLATTPERYSTVYLATYKESVREYDYTLPTSDGTFTVSLDETVGEKIPHGKSLIFTVTLDEGYTQTAPVVKSDKAEIAPVSVSGNSYTYEIKADGDDAEKIIRELTDITVETAINHYTVKISGDSGATISTDGFTTEYNGEDVFVVTLKDSHTQTAPVVKAADGNRVKVTLVSSEGNTYIYKVSEIKSDAEITVTTKINEYRVILKNWDGSKVFNGMVKYGEAPKYTNPTKPVDANGAYDFAGWDTDGDKKVDVKTIENVTEDITATALYDYNHRHDSDPSDPSSVWELDKTVKANCTKDGMKYYVCKHCGKETKNVVIPARGHKWTAEGEGWIIVKAPTCTETGLKSRYCCNKETDEYEACNHKEENVIVPATGHHDADGDYKCDDCGADLGHCSSCICHKGNVLSKVIRRICTLLSKIFHTEIKCCKCMEWYGDEISSIS